MATTTSGRRGRRGGRAQAATVENPKATKTTETAPVTETTPATETAPATDKPADKPAKAPKPQPVVFAFVRPTARGDWYATIPAKALSQADIDSGYVRLSGDAKEVATVRFGGAAGAIIESLKGTPKKQQALAIASIGSMVQLVADGYKNDARKNAIASPAVAVAEGAAKNAVEGGQVRKRLRSVPAGARADKAQAILADARKPKAAPAPAAAEPAKTA